MNGISTLKHDIINYLTDAPELDGVRIMDAYPARRESLTQTPVLTVGIDGVDISPVGFGGIFGENPDHAAVYACSALVTLRFDMFSQDEGERCHSVYESLAEAMLSGSARFGFTRLSCGELSRDSSAGAWRLTARAELRSALDSITPAAGYNSEEDNL